MAFTSKHLGALLGFGFGWLIVQYGLISAVFVGAVALGGWAIGRVLDGEIDVSAYIRPRGPQDFE